jgi:hypothetical protein
MSTRISLVDITKIGIQLGIPSLKSRIEALEKKVAILKEANDAKKSIEEAPELKARYDELHKKDSLTTEVTDGNEQ